MDIASPMASIISSLYTKNETISYVAICKSMMTFASFYLII